MNTTLRIGVLAGMVAVILFSGFLVSADHTWGPYHWARTSNPFILNIGDNVSSAWDPYLVTTVADWSASSVLDLTIVKGNNTKFPKYCKAVAGRGEVCNAKFGSNGWLGIAQIWASGEHITQGVVKMNDTYFTTSTYNTPAWRNLVMCQEVGHILGLAHQDENMTNANLGSCMDYTNLPDSNQHPNAHDYEMLETIYAHLDSSTTLSQASVTKAQVPAAIEDIREWGRELRRSGDGRVSLFVRDFGDTQVFTHVFWVGEEGHDHDHEEEVDRFSRVR